MVLEGLFWIIGIIFIILIAYLYFLAAASLLPQRQVNFSQKPNTRFAVIVPAHNEARVIGRTLESLNRANYPRGLFETIVIADNCSDETARIVEGIGVTCWKRTDRKHKGKGFALQWAFERLKSERIYENLDAVVIVDADTLTDADFLGAMDRRISLGEKAVQGYYDVINPDASPMASLSYFGFVISRNLRFKGRTRMGWSNNLLGNGMCFSTQIRDAVPKDVIKESSSDESILRYSFKSSNSTGSAAGAVLNSYARMF